MIDFLISGLSGFGIWGILLYGFVVTHITIAAVTIYLHRCAAHRAVDLHPVISHFFRCWLWLTTGMVTKQWVAIHRKHHVMCETEDDPHSPQILGLNEVLLRGAELYRSEGKNEETLEKYGTGSPEDWVERNFYTGRSTLGIFLMLIANLLILGVPGLTIWAVQMMWIPIWAAGVINGVGHYLGYRNYECPDAATNIVPWGILIGGEELHNNHHTYPNSAKFSRKWWEIDLGWIYVCILSALRLAKVRSTGPVVHRDEAKTEVDIDTVRGIINDRFRVLLRFKQDVLEPTVTEEQSDAKKRKTLKNAQKLLAREDSLQTDDDLDRIKDIISENGNLGTIYNLQQSLKGVWDKRGQSKDELLSAFNSWLEEAERTGLERVHEFSRSLRSYTLPQDTATNKA